MCTLALSFTIIKLFGAQWITDLFNKGSFDLLNNLAFVQENRSLDYYLGRIEDKLLGPLSSIIGGMILLLICLRKSTTLIGIRYFFAILAYLFLTRPEVLFHPPYGESITGPFSDVVWLLRHNLDYFGLLQQDTFTTGGVQIYPTSLYPLALAVMMKLAANVKVFIFTQHLLVFAFSASIVTLLRNFLTETFGKVLGLYGSLLLLFLPLYQSMTEMINMEIPCLFFLICTIYFFGKDKFMLASFCAIISLLIKAPGIIACLTIFTVSFLFFWRKPSSPWNLYRLLWGTLALCAAVAKAFLRNQMLGEQLHINKVSFLIGWSHTKTSPWFWLFVCATVILIVREIQIWKGEKRKLNEFYEFIQPKWLIITIFLVTGLWFLIYLNFSVLAYRYQLLLAPFMIFCICYLIISLTNKNISSKIFIGLIFLSLISSHGLLYAHQKENSWNPTHLERSLEYRNYLKLQKRIIQEVEENYTHYTIGAPFGAAQTLGIKELGYTEMNLDVMLYGMRPTNGLRGFKKLKDLDISQTIWIGFKEDQIIKGIDYPIDSNDRVIKKIEVGDRRVYIFMGGFAIEKMRIIAGMVKGKK